MDSLTPIYPPPPKVAPEKQESLPVLPAQPKAEPPTLAPIDSKLPQTAQPLSSFSNGDLTSTPLPEHHQPRQLYSPTRTEIESHPIVQHYAPICDEIATGLGSAPDESRSRQEPTAISAMADKEIKEGDEVSWQWSAGRPGGTVDEVKEQGELAITTKKGNEVKKNADPEDPAVKVSRSGNDVVKRAHELKVEEEGDKHKEANGDDKAVGDDEKKAEENGDVQTGDKRKADVDTEKDAKKQKTDAPTENGEKAAPRKKGRPAKKDANGTTKAKAEPKKKREPKKAATESGEPRRSGRRAGKS